MRGAWAVVVISVMLPGCTMAVTKSTEINIVTDDVTIEAGAQINGD